MPKNKSIIRQVQEALNQKLCIGESKHAAKQQGIASDGIYSWSTYQNYLSKACTFAKWTRELHNCKTLDDARSYVNSYIQKHIDQNYSPYTQKLIACALAKVYGCSTKDFCSTQVRHRANIVRSRLDKAMLAETKNKEFVDFCKSTGLRRHELKNLKRENLRIGATFSQCVLVIKGKGGRVRECPILSKEAIKRIMNTSPDKKVWSKIPSRADIHSYRAEYCKTIYDHHKRPFPEIPINERYYCRGDMKGIVYDKRAMMIASRALGHNRVSIIAEHYLYVANYGDTHA